METDLKLERRDFLDRAERFAGYLQDRVQPGDRVAIVMENRLEYMIAILGVVANRGAVVPINPRSRAFDLEHVLNSSGVELAIVEQTLLPKLKELGDRCPALAEFIPVGASEPNGLPHSDRRLRFNETECRRNDIIGVWYTSGTTGLPKGCMVDHEWALRVTDVAMRMHPVGPSDRISCPLRFYYADPLLDLLRALKCGGTAVYVYQFSVSRFWQMISERAVTSISTIASMPSWLLKAPPSALDRQHRMRFALHSAVPKDAHHELDERFGFNWLENYGLMESGVISRMPFEHAVEMRGSGSVGVAAPEVSIKILDDVGNELMSGEVGEIVVQAPGMFRGYLGMPEATEEIMRDGWIYTGDLGFLDEHQFLYLSGRKKDMIRRSGENIAAGEVEAVLRMEPRVLEAAVIAVPDADHGEEVKCFVRLKDGLDPASVKFVELISFCSAHLAPHKVPRYIEFIDDFEFTPSMRVKKAPLEQLPTMGPGTWDRLSNNDSKEGAE